MANTADKLQVLITQGKTGKQRPATLEFKRAKNKQHFWTLTACNGQQIATSFPELYKKKASCIKNAYEILLCKWSIES